MNNKGFAITGILYTLFILFLLIAISVLGSLSAKKNMLQQSVTTLEKKFQGTYSPDAMSGFNGSTTEFKVPYDGKYIFSVTNINKSKTYTCYTYLRKDKIIKKEDRKIQGVTFIPNDCNIYEIDTITLVKVYRFE